MSDNDELNREINHYVPPAKGPEVCKGCNGSGMQKRNDGINITCPMCNGTGTFIPPGTIIWATPPQPVYIVPNPNEEKPKVDPGWEYLPPPTVDPDPWRRRYYTGDNPRDWHGPPKVIC